VISPFCSITSMDLITTRMRSPKCCAHTQRSTLSALCEHREALAGCGALRQRAALEPLGDYRIWQNDDGYGVVGREHPPGNAQQKLFFFEPGRR
jgi:hypothetical protein